MHITESNFEAFLMAHIIWPTKAPAVSYYQQGVNAFKDGLTVNPYFLSQNKSAALQWQRGFNQSQRNA